MLLNIKLTYWREEQLSQQVDVSEILDILSSKYAKRKFLLQLSVFTYSTTVCNCFSFLCTTDKLKPQLFQMRLQKMIKIMITHKKIEMVSGGGSKVGD